LSVGDGTLRVARDEGVGRQSKQQDALNRPEDEGVGLFSRVLDMGDDIGQNTAFYYNLTTKQVEREGQSKAKDLLGPFPTEAEAANALEIIREREERKNAEDSDWRNK
jgi:hypothetical protein